MDEGGRIRPVAGAILNGYMRLCDRQGRRLDRTRIVLLLASSTAERAAAKDPHSLSYIGVLIAGRDMSIYEGATESRTTTTNSADETTQRLQGHLDIPTAVARLLYQAGYSHPQSLGSASPNEVALKLSALSSMSAISAQELLPMIRRIVLLGSLEDPLYASATAERFQDMSKEELERKGVWEEGFDDLTGAEIWRRMEQLGG
ncbi:uncharacterized protein LTR77_010767 [Saxophila tyrrhenica]|uniref:Proteasome assembly chaperone 2 n=1 Tax=Saxophila tyrrhenica TaxID=1690608 RepID=A0AAV9NX65_9PEZI|nr:hypothetical protein LTR77_010767 [Saxophila tyrrhenica]